MRLALLLLVASTAPSEASLPDMGVAQIEAKVLASRRQIHSGKVSFTINMTKADGSERETPLTVWFDHDKKKIRTDGIVPAKKSIAPYRQIQCVNCEKPDYSVEYHEVILENGGQVVLQLAPVKGGRTFRLFDPRLLGFIPEQPLVLYTCHLESVIGRGDSSSPTVRQDRLRGVDCYVIAFDTKNLNRYEYWVAPSKGYMLLRIGVTDMNPGSGISTVVENELRQFERGGIWYPKTCVCTRTDKGKVVRKGVVRTTSAEFNVIDDSVFSLAGMGLKDYVVVDYRKPDGTSTTYTWKGQKLTDFVQPKFVLPQPPESASRKWLYGLAGGLAALAFAAFGLYWWRRTPLASLRGSP